MTHEKRLAVLERVPVNPFSGKAEYDALPLHTFELDGYVTDLRLFDQTPTSHDAEWQRRLDEWRSSPGTVILICPACNALRGLHKLSCELR